MTRCAVLSPTDTISLLASFTCSFSVFLHVFYDVHNFHGKYKIVEKGDQNFLEKKRFGVRRKFMIFLRFY